MTKPAKQPWEENWACVPSAGGWAIRDATSKGLLLWDEDCSFEEPQAKLIAAAPALARFARNVMQGAWTRDEGEKVLANAGVPLPEMELSEETKLHEQLTEQRDALARALCSLRSQKGNGCWCLLLYGDHSDACLAARAALVAAGVEL